MKTQILNVYNDVDNEECYQQAVDKLKSGELVAFPTETVYGLGAVATNEAAVQKIYEAKGRPSDNPLIIHIGTKEEVQQYAQAISKDALLLMDTFWPGPLTLVFQQVPNTIAKNAIPGVASVGLRMPDHPVALRLLRKLQLPVAAPSANRSGKPSPTEAAHVYQDLQGRLPLILDGGQTGVGLESTVLDVTTTPPTILRPGGITRDMLEAVIGPVQAATQVDDEQAPRSPGMKYTHYAPEAPLYIVRQNRQLIDDAIQHCHTSGQTVAVIGPDEYHTEAADWYFSIGAVHDIATQSALLYKALRQCDDTTADVILATETKNEGLGIAFMNRLFKAAGGKRYPTEK